MLFCFLAALVLCAAQGAELQQVRALLNTTRWREADDLLQKYLVKNPDSAEAHALRGLVLYREHQPRASMAEYVRASETGDLSAFDLRIFALDCAAIPDLPEAERWLDRSLQKDSQAAATWEALGHVRFSAEKYADAIQALKHALELAPETESSEVLIGLAFERMAQGKEAKDAYQTAIAWQRKEKDPLPYLGMGRVLLTENEIPEAIAFLEQAVRISSSTPEAHELLGLAYQKSNRNPDAAKQLALAIEMAPQDARLHLMLARVYRSMGQAAHAQAEQDKYVALKASVSR